jgi:hypothetical protein
MDGDEALGQFSGRGLRVPALLFGELEDTFVLR